MTELPSVLVDTDVIISSLISRTGAAYLLINEVTLVRFISSIQLGELKRTAVKLGLDQMVLSSLLDEKFEVVPIKETGEKIKEIYGGYVTHGNDAHLVAGADSGGVSFLITYNLRHYRAEKIKRSFGVMVITPAYFTQYLRSQRLI